MPSGSLNGRPSGNAAGTVDVSARPELAGPRFPFRSLFAIEIDSVEPIIAPSYRLYPETSEARQVDSAMKRYGVRPDTD